MAMRSGEEGSVARLAVALVVVLVVAGCASGTGARPTSDVASDTKRPGAAQAPAGAREPDPAPEPNTSGSEAGTASMAPRPARSSPGRRGDSGTSHEPMPRYITGLRLDAVKAVLERHGVSCLQQPPTDAGAPWSCWWTSPDGSVDYSVTVDATDEHRVGHITALITQFESADPALAEAFLGDLAALAYKGAQPDAARGWVRDWLAGRDATPDQVTLGHAALALQGTVESCSLDIAALDALSE